MNHELKITEYQQLNANEYDFYKLYPRLVIESKILDTYNQLIHNFSMFRFTGIILNNNKPSFLTYNHPISSFATNNHVNSIDNNNNRKYLFFQRCILPLILELGKLLFHHKTWKNPCGKNFVEYISQSSYVSPSLLNTMFNIHVDFLPFISMIEKQNIYLMIQLRLEWWAKFNFNGEITMMVNNNAFSQQENYSFSEENKKLLMNDIYHSIQNGILDLEMCQFLCIQIKQNTCLSACAFIQTVHNILLEFYSVSKVSSGIILNDNPLIFSNHLNNQNNTSADNNTNETTNKFLKNANHNNNKQFILKQLPRKYIKQSDNHNNNHLMNRNEKTVFIIPNETQPLVSFDSIHKGDFGVGGNGNDNEANATTDDNFTSDHILHNEEYKIKNEIPSIIMLPTQNNKLNNNGGINNSDNNKKPIQKQKSNHYFNNNNNYKRKEEKDNKNKMNHNKPTHHHHNNKREDDYDRIKKKLEGIKPNKNKKQKDKEDSDDESSESDDDHDDEESKSEDSSDEDKKKPKNKYNNNNIKKNAWRR
jgi:hypothetical protein